jgi:hypothetical protein
MNEPDRNLDRKSVSRVIPVGVKRQFIVSKRWQLFWYNVHYISGICAVIAGGLATASGANVEAEFLNEYAWVWGLTATFLAGVVTFLGPLQQAEKYKKSYHLLNTGIERFKAEIIAIDELLNILERSQNIITGGEPTTP